MENKKTIQLINGSQIVWVAMF